MPGSFIHRGTMSIMDGDRYIILNPADLDRAKQLLDEHIARIYKSIDYNLFEIEIGNGRQAVAISSADPGFYFGIGENGVLHKAGIKHLIGSGEGGFVNVKNVEGVRQHSDFLGLAASGAAGLSGEQRSNKPSVATSRLYSEERQMGGITVKASLGNLVHAEADALVVPQFLNCASEGGVGYAIMSAGAERGVVDEYAAELQRRGSFNFGDAFVTPSHGGATKSLIHAISVGSGREREFTTINTAVCNALAAADRAGVSRVAFPMLGTGIIGTLDDRQSAQAMLMAVTDYTRRNPTSSVKSIELVVYGDPRSHARNPSYQALRGTLFDDALPQVPIQAGRREFDAERWARELEATTKRPKDKTFIQQVAQALGIGKRRLDS